MIFIEDCIGQIKISNFKHFLKGSRTCQLLWPLMSIANSIDTTCIASVWNVQSCISIDTWLMMVVRLFMLYKVQSLKAEPYYTFFLPSRIENNMHFNVIQEKKKNFHCKRAFVVMIITIIYEFMYLQAAVFAGLRFCYWFQLSSLLVW